MSASTSSELPRRADALQSKPPPSGPRGKAHFLRTAWSIINETLDDYSRDRGDAAAAALAFHALLSIAPLLIIAIAIAGAVLGESTARAEVAMLLARTMGQDAAVTVDGWVSQANESGGLASVIGAVLLFFTASRLGDQLRNALNQVWGIDVYVAESFKATISDYLQRRIVAFALVLSAGPLLLLVFASRALLSGASELLFGGFAFGGAVTQALQLAGSIVLVAVMTAAAFRLLPDTHVGWRAILPGALLTSLLFNLGNVAVGLYLGRAGAVAMYGAAGSAVVILLWVYFSAQLFLYGAEFTEVYARRYGRGLTPREAREVRVAEDQGEHAEHEAEQAEHDAEQAEHDAEQAEQQTTTAE
jgi:membrane protein